MTAAAGALPATLAAFADAPIFMPWKYSEPDAEGRRAKRPYNPHKQAKPENRCGYTYRGASSTDPASWGTAAEALAAIRDWRRWFDGLGLVGTSDMVLGDVDHCRDPQTGALSAEAEALRAALAGRAFMCVSPSGTGMRFIVLGQIPDSLKTDALELYKGGGGRFVTITAQELPGSAAPAPAQDVLDALWSRYGAHKAQRQAAGALALTAELQSEIREAQDRIAELLDGLKNQMPPQLRNLLERDELPSALAAYVKGGGMSERRACVVAQLCYTRRYTDAQIYALARRIWHGKRYESSKTEAELHADCMRLIGEYKAYWSSQAKPTPAPAPEPQPRALGALGYLRLLADQALGVAVLLNREERAALAGVSRPTAQRYEEQLQAEGLIELYTYAIGGQRGRRGALRLTLAALDLLGESVKNIDFAPPADTNSRSPRTPDLVNNSASERAETVTTVCNAKKEHAVASDMPPALGDDAAFWAQAAEEVRLDADDAPEPQRQRRRPLSAEETPAERRIKRERETAAEAPGFTPRQQRLALERPLHDWTEADSRMLGALFLPDEPIANTSTQRVLPAAPPLEPPPVPDAPGLIARLKQRRDGIALTV